MTQMPIQAVGVSKRSVKRSTTNKKWICASGRKISQDRERKYLKRGINLHFPFSEFWAEELKKWQGRREKQNKKPVNQPTKKKKKPEMEARGSEYPEKKLFMIQMELRM